MDESLHRNLKNPDVSFILLLKIRNINITRYSIYLFVVFNLTDFKECLMLFRRLGACYLELFLLHFINKRRLLVNA